MKFKSRNSKSKTTSVNVGLRHFVVIFSKESAEKFDEFITFEQINVEQNTDL